MVEKVLVLLLGGLKLNAGPGVFTAFDLHKVDVPLIWKGPGWLGWRTLEAGGVAVAGAECCLFPRAPPYFSAGGEWLPGIVPWHFFHWSG
eukprot:1155776-Pelagomonas_calceolata.AAC.3